MKVLITGATGLLGNNLARMALEQGSQVRVLIRSAKTPESLRGLSVEVFRGELNDSQVLNSAMAGVDLVLHCAGFVQIGWRELEQARQINVIGTRQVAQAARLAGARMVHVSTVNTLALGAPNRPADETTPICNQVPCAYVISKREADQAVREEIAQGLDAVIVHPGFMLGAWDWKPSSGRMLLQVASYRPLLAPPGGCSVVDVKNVAHGVLQAAAVGRRGESYILAGVNLSYFDLWSRMAKCAGVRGPLGRLGKIVGRTVGIGSDLWTRIRGKEADINGAAIRMGAQFHYYSSAKAQQELGYQIGEADQAILNAWTWFCEKGYAKSQRKS